MLGRPARVAIAGLAAAALVAGLALYGERRVEKMGGYPERAAREGKAVPLNDFVVYLEAARRVREPDLYERDLTRDGRRYLYPPLLACALTALVPMGPTGAAWTWYVLCVLAALGGIVAATRLAAGRAAPRRDLAVALGAGLLLALPFFDDDLRNGNANGLVFAFTSLGGLALARGRPTLGGLSFALATALKVMPAIVLPWLLLRGAWRASGAFLAGLVLFLAIVPAAVVGPTQTGRLLAGFAEAFAGPEVASTKRPDGSGPPGFSLRCLLVRTLSDETWPTKWNEPRIRLARLPPRVVLGLVLAGSVAILAVSYAATSRRRRGDHPGPASLEDPATPFDLSILAAAAVVVSPVSFRANFLALFLPAAVIGLAWWRARGRASARRTWAAALLAFAIALNPLTDVGLVGRELAGVEFALCVLFLSPFAMWLGVLLARRALTSP